VSRTLAALVIAAGLAQIGAVEAEGLKSKIEMIDVPTQPMTFDNAACKRLQAIYHAALALGHQPQYALYAAEARELAMAGRCPMAPFAKILMERTAPPAR
jgi:hypothetical protein